MATTQYKCPKHNVKLRTIEGYPEALVCPAGVRLCPTVFTVIEGHLCRDDGELSGWTDIQTGEVREAQA